MTRVLITGGSGLVGAMLARRLMRAGDDVVLVDLRSSSPIIDSLGEDALRFYAGSIQDRDLLARIMAAEKPEVVYHLAAVLGAVCNDDPILCAQANCVGTATVLEQSLRSSVGRVVLASSVAVYGPDDLYPPGPIDEDSPLHLSETYRLYGTTKLFLESAAHLYARKGLSTCGLRLSMALGAGRARTSASYAIGSLIDGVALSGRGRIEVSPSDAICYVYVEDVAAQLQALGSAPDEAFTRRRFFNGGGEVVTLADFVQTLRSVVPGAAIQVVERPTRQLHRATLRVSDDNLRRDVGVARTYDVARGLAAHVAEARHLHELGLMDAAPA